MAKVYDPNLCVFAQTKNKDGIPLCVMYRNSRTVEEKTAALRIAPVHRCAGCPQSVHNLCSREYLEHHPIFTVTEASDEFPALRYEEEKQWCYRCLRVKLGRLPSKPPGSERWRLPEGPPEILPLDSPTDMDLLITAAQQVSPFAPQGKSHADFANFTELKPSFKVHFDYPRREGDPATLTEHPDYLVYKEVATNHLNIELDGVVMDYELPNLEEVHANRIAEGHLMFAHGYHCREKILIQQEPEECGKFKWTGELQPISNNRYSFCFVRHVQRCYTKGWW